MIDRIGRDEVISTFEDYLDDKISAFEFDDRLHEIESVDQTVNEVVHAAWFHYDDCKDHKVNLSKQGWDYFQRLLLILRSDAELSSSVTRHWSWDHAIAWTALAAFVGIASAIGWGYHLYLVAMPFGAISILISRYRQCRLPELSAHQIACTPFGSYSQIRWLRRQVPEFRKRRYRTEIDGRKTRSEAEELVMRAFSYCSWIVFSPFVLLFQGFPSCCDLSLECQMENGR